MPSWPGVFQLGTFFIAVPSESMYNFTFSHSSNPFYYFPMFLIHSDFLYVLLVAICCSKIVLLSLHQVVGMSSRHLSLLLLLLFVSFSHLCLLMVFLWNLSVSKSLQVSRTLINILADLSNTVVSMILIRPPFSNNIIIIILQLSSFLQPASADVLSLGSVWQQVSLGLYVFYE